MTPLRAGLRAGLAVLVVALASPFVLAASAGAAQSEPRVTMSATLGGQSLQDIRDGDPLVLDPEQELEVRVEMRNTGSAPAEVRYVRLDGRVLNMTFFSHSARIDARVDPGTTDSRVFTFDLGDLGDQATGLFPARLLLLDADRDPLAEQSLPVEVKGSLGSTYGVFSVLVAVATALLLAIALLRLALGRLTEHRWFRATRFAVPGAGVGLTAVFTLSALGVLVPSPDRSIGLVIAGTLLGMVLGFLTPAPYSGEQRESEAQVEHDAELPDPPDAGPPADVRAEDAPGVPLPPPRRPGLRAARQHR